MEVQVNSQKIQIQETTTLRDLLIKLQLNIQVDYQFLKNGQPINTNLDQIVKSMISSNDNLEIKQKAYRQPAMTTMNQPSNFQFQQQHQNINLQFRATNGVQNQDKQQYFGNFNQTQQTPIFGSSFAANPKMPPQTQQVFAQQGVPYQGVPYQGVPQQFFQQQGVPQQVVPQQIFSQQVVQQQIKPDTQQIQSNQTPTQNFQQQNQDIFATIIQENVDVFATAICYKDYDQQREDYLKTKSTNPGEKKFQYKTKDYQFTLDNYGDQLIVEGNDNTNSFYMKFDNQFQPAKSKETSGPSKEQFESNIRFSLNYTRVAWIDQDNIMIVQFNNGNKVLIKLYME